MGCVILGYDHIVPSLGLANKIKIYFILFSVFMLNGITEHVDTTNIVTVDE